MHYFESKDGVFRAAVKFPVDPAEFIPRLLAPGLDGLGERLVRVFVETWDSPAGSPLLGLIRSVVGNEDAAALLREFITREVLGPIARALELDQPQLRAALVASQLVGLALIRYVARWAAGADHGDVSAAGLPSSYFTDPGVTRIKKRSGRRR
jgi:AcrR family transcriptional regulator